MMKTKMTLKDVQAVYSGPEGKLWELIMGDQIHVGGWKSSMELAKLANIKAGMKVLDICSALGAGLRFLVRNFDVYGYGVDATEYMNKEARKRIQSEGLEDRIEVVLGDAQALPWDAETFDVVWGEDAWCYVEDKAKLVSEAARVLKPGGTIAFTDWIVGKNGLTPEENDRITTFMKFPYMESFSGYEDLLKKNRFRILHADDLTPDFAEHIGLYLNMVGEQLTFDVLKILGNDTGMLEAIGKEMMYMKEKASAGKFGRGRWVAVRE